MGVILTSSAPKYIGTVRKPVIPMSWNSGSQLTMTSVSRSYSAPTNIASALEYRFRWLIRTALGGPVEPEVNCISATSSSPTSTGSIGVAASSCSMVTTVSPRSASTGAAAMNGSDTTTVSASITSTTATVSAAHFTRSVRGVGWCSMVRLAPRIHTPWAVGAISTGKPANLRSRRRDRLLRRQAHRLSGAPVGGPVSRYGEPAHVVRRSPAPGYSSARSRTSLR